MRLPCPVGHYGLLSILGGSARPPSLLTLPLLWADVASCNIYTALLPTPACVPFVTFAHPWPGMPSLASCVRVGDWRGTPAFGMEAILRVAERGKPHPSLRGMDALS